ncbi:hypothetical protein OSB04_027507 [Centaurea solstitialis]|uniref:Reverse transcriptase zinc-binding domain-containing protein n=1 Tax=Centaurea solstitialis TaxID=347529 RepID=A0AA38SQZ8_9ASTR|nr:hypothetical protein OSB04_027507 [Centaurea solstitialis]
MEVWREVIIELYGPSGGFDNPNIHGGKGIWETIVSSCQNLSNLGLNFLASITKSIANSCTVKFWTDPSIGLGEKLKDKFPRLFTLESNKEVVFKDLWSFSAEGWQGSWYWRTSLRGRLLDEVNELTNFLSKANFRPQGVAKGASFPWISIVPLKVNIFSWRLMNGGLPTHTNLARRHIYVGTDLCVLCNQEQESEDHFFFQCPSVQGTWRKLWAWWNVNLSVFSSLEVFKSELFGGENRRPVNLNLQAICMVLLWLIWKKRNPILYADVVDVKRLKDEDIFPTL